MILRIGTAGWQYDHWRGAFYPKETSRRRWLEYYSGCFATVESNSAFYRLPETETLRDWVSRTPKDFSFAIKASRYLTHVRRLREPAEPVRRLVERLESLGEKLGPVLLQLPPNMVVDADALEEVLRAFPVEFRVAVEVRHPSWFDNRIRRLLEKRKTAWCLTDVAGRHPPLWRTAEWGYVRFHRGRSSPAPCYGRSALEGWVRRLLELWPSGDVHCYFNNDEEACAVRDAHRLALAAARFGAEVTRTPSRSSKRFTKKEKTPDPSGQ